MAPFAPSETAATAPRRCRERGATLVGYALLMSAVVVIGLGVLQSFEDNSSAYLTNSASSIGQPMEGRESLRNRAMDPAPAWVTNP